MKRHSELLQLSREHYGALSRFADLLAAHVRFEEREVFEAAQTRLAMDSVESTP